MFKTNRKKTVYRKGRRDWSQYKWVGSRLVCPECNTSHEKPPQTVYGRKFCQTCFLKSSKIVYLKKRDVFIRKSGGKPNVGKRLAGRSSWGQV